MNNTLYINRNKISSRLLFGLVVYLLFVCILKGQSTFNFEYLDISNGLPHNTVFTSLQDNHGYIWLGTQDGLVRYDSKSTKIYNKSTDSTFLGKNIQSLAENKQGDLYIGTRGDGLIVKSGRTGKFGTIGNKELDQALSRGWIKHLMIDNLERLWISTLENGLWVYDQKGKTFDKFTKENSALNSNQISSTVQDTEGNIWIASSSDKLFWVERNTLNVKEFEVPNVNFFGFRKTLYCDSGGRIWLGTEGHGLYLIDPKNNTARLYSMQNGLSSNTISHLLEWQKNKLLIATDGGGLNILDIENQKIEVYKSQQGKFPLNTNALYHLNIDNDRNLWISTYNGGVNISKSNKMTFETYQFEEQTPEIKSIKSVLSIAKSYTNNLWIGTDGDGVYEFDLVTKTMNEKNQILGSHKKIIKAIHEDSKHNLWVGVYNEGLIKYNPHTKKVVRYFPNEDPKTSINGWNIWSISEDDQENIWIGILGGGINKIDTKKDKIHSFVHVSQDSSTVSGNGVMIIKFDHNNNAWIGTNTTGLNFYDAKTNRFKRFYHNPFDPKTISANDIRCIFQDSKDRIWIGTESGGLNLLLEDYSFRSFKLEDGLISNAVLGIQEDTEGNIWLSSFNGISRFEMNTNTFQNFNFHQYFSITTNQFNMMSSYSDSNYMAFGGINGLTLFKPKEYNKRQFKPKVLFNDFKIFNKSADTSKMVSITLGSHCTIENAEKVNLSYAENTFSFEFISIDFVNGDNLRYEYKMQGFDQEWRKTNGQQREVTYTNLDPGTYTFVVRAYAPPNQWGPEKKIEITIDPLYWQTWWFRIAVVLSVIGLTLYLFLTYLKNREMALNQAVLESNELILKITNEKLKTDQEVLNLINDKLEMDILNKNTDLLSQTAKIAHKNEVLLDIKKLLSEIDDSNEKTLPRFIRNLKTLVDAELEDKKNWERFQQYFDQINQNFRSNLLDKHPTLTQTDLLICTLTKLNLSNKEMALLLNLSIPGIEKSRYRLKKRLKLSSSDDLNTYLRSI
jgi:ligand-binding sensor domain-containing protein/DNA-binding CsgD family transcriptional regulator